MVLSTDWMGDGRAVKVRCSARSAALQYTEPLPFSGRYRALTWVWKSKLLGRQSSTKCYQVMVIC